jgi:pimeloyl-ACP methyl ester carboxylesterase
VGPNRTVEWAIEPSKKMWAPEVGLQRGDRRAHVLARACVEDLTDVLGRIDVPTLLVYGEEDTRAPAGVAEKLHAAIPGSQLIRLAGAGHVCSVDAVEAFNGALRRFLEQHPPR